MTHGIVIAGANGSGKTTLGRQLAAALGYHHMDIEDYAFYESAIPYSAPRPRDEVIRLLLADMNRFGRFVLTAVNGDFGEEIGALYDCVVVLHAPLETRLDRVRKRNLDQFGSRALEGGDLYGQQKRFTDFVASRTMDKMDAWVQSVACPVLHADGTKPVAENVRLIQERVFQIVKVCFYESVPDELLKFAVIVARTDGKWVFCKHRSRSTCEIPGGHREAGEAILETARRELYEETGPSRSTSPRSAYTP